MPAGSRAADASATLVVVGVVLAVSHAYLFLVLLEILGVPNIP